MSDDDKLIVRGVKTDYEEPLGSIIDPTFQISWQKNDSYTLSLTAISENSIAFESLGPQASLFWKNQEFIVKQAIFDFKSGQGVKQITAVHVYSELERVFQRKVNDGVKTYSVNDVLAFYLDDNDFGFSYQVIGEFPKEQIENLGCSSGKDMISKIFDTWPDAVIFPEGRCIKIYQQDSFAKDLGGRIDYLHDTNEVQLTYDTNSIVNKLYCIGKQKDEDQGGGNYFEPFFVQDDDSINQWGVFDGGNFSDDRFTNPDSMKASGEAKLSPEPIISIAVTQDFNIPVIPGEIRRLEIRPQKYVTKVEVVGFTIFPKDKKSPTQITLNNKAMSILEYNNRLSNRIRAISDYGTKIDGLYNNYDLLSKKQEQDAQAIQGAKNDIYWMNNGKNNLIKNADFASDDLKDYSIDGKASIDNSTSLDGTKSLQIDGNSSIGSNVIKSKQEPISVRVYANKLDTLSIQLQLHKSNDASDIVFKTIDIKSAGENIDQWNKYQLVDFILPEFCNSYRLFIKNRTNEQVNVSRLQINKGYKLTDWKALTQTQD